MSLLSIIEGYLGSGHQRIRSKAAAIEILRMHIQSVNRRIIVGTIIVDSFLGIAARGIDGDFIGIFSKLTATSLLFHGSEDMEELADGGFFVFLGDRVHFNKRSADKTGGRRKISW